MTNIAIYILIFSFLAMINNKLSLDEVVQDQKKFIQRNLSFDLNK